MSKIQTIKDKDGNIVYPQTAVQAIYDENGKTLNTVLTDFVKADEAGSSVEDVNNNPELVANKVTSIDSNSTDTQYPSAKAVYNSILANKSVGIKISVVDELPTENIDDKTMYLKSNGTSETQNIYDEYLYVNNNWEHIGSTATTVDLSEYLKVSDAEDNYVRIMTDGDFLLTIQRSSDEAVYGPWVDKTILYMGNSSSNHPFTYGTIYMGRFLGIDPELGSAFLWSAALQNYTLPEADDFVLGGVRLGAGLTTTTNSWSQKITTLAPATANTIGGIKIGDGLSVDDSGVVSVSSSGGIDSDIINIIQGTENKATVFNNNVITETTDDIVMTTTFNDDGSITETRTSTKYGNISKKTVFNDDGSITETILS